MFFHTPSITHSWFSRYFQLIALKILVFTRFSWFSRFPIAFSNRMLGPECAKNMENQENLVKTNIFNVLTWNIWNTWNSWNVHMCTSTGAYVTSARAHVHMCLCHQPPIPYSRFSKYFQVVTSKMLVCTRYSWFSRFFNGLQQLYVRSEVCRKTRKTRKTL